MLGNKLSKTVIGSSLSMPSAKQGLKPTSYSLINQQTYLNIPGSYLVGASQRKPGLTIKGRIAEDMIAGDSPVQSTLIRNDPMFQKSDSELNAFMIVLMKSLSTGAMRTVALEMQKQFADGIGGTYSNKKILDTIVRGNPAFDVFHRQFLEKLIPVISRKIKSYDPSANAPFSSPPLLAFNPPLTMNLLNFSSIWDKMSGLGITVHQVWSVKAELYNLKIRHGYWVGQLEYTFYDHFGLDWPDVLKTQNTLLPHNLVAGDGFKAWYILQHYRSAKPFITEMTCRVTISSRI